MEAEARNTGKPVGLTTSEEIPPMVDQIRFFAGAARTLEGKAAAEYMAGHTSFVRREPIEPGRFLPIAEEFGLIVEIDALMVRRAAELAARGHRVNVNLSAQSVAKPGMSDFIGGEISRLGADPSLIAVELTETALITSEHAARRFVERLADLGCDFALDDFGTGYGGFMYLKQLPIDYLKIDMEFGHDLTTNEGSKRVVRAVVDLAKGFGQRTIAEGIEDEETRDVLVEMGVDYGQGFLFGHPTPTDVVWDTANGETDGEDR